MSPRLPLYSPLLWLLILGSMTASHRAHGAAPDESSLTITDVQIGLDGFYKVGVWSPIAVTVEGTSAAPVRLVVEVKDPDGNSTRQPSNEFQLSSSGGRLQSLFIAGRMDGVIHLQVESGEQILARSTLRASATNDGLNGMPWPLSQATELWAVLGDVDGFRATAAGLNGPRSSSSNAAGPGGSPAVVIVPRFDETTLAQGVAGLNSLDLLVVTDLQQLSDKAAESIRQWVLAGGHLILATSDEIALKASPLQAWLPVRVLGESRLRDLSGLTRLLPGQEPLRITTVDALRFEFDAGNALVTGLDGPVLARLPLGFGRITLLGLDLHRPPLAGWSGAPALCELLADVRESRAGSASTSATLGRSESGVSDIQTQLAAAIDQFPASGKLTNRLVMGLLLLYLLLIGPLDYLLVHRVLRRPEWTWFTFPLMVLAGASIAARYSNAHTPQTVTANCLEIVDIDKAYGVSRTHSWIAFLSPASQRYAIAARPTDMLPRDGEITRGWQHLNWTGLPESGFRGMYRTGGLELAKPSYTFAPNGIAIEDLPVAVRSTGNVTSSEFFGLSASTQSVQSTLTDNRGQLTGTITNELPVPISDWLLVHASRVYRPSENSFDPAVHRLAPGETLSLSDRNKVIPRVLKGYLTGVRRTTLQRTDRAGEDVVAGRENYDPLDRDPTRIVRTLSFFEAAGGEDYTTIRNQSLGAVDLSPLLHLDRAVLYGEVDLSAQEILIDGAPPQVLQQNTIIRVVLPVDRIVAPTGVRQAPREEPS